jgi:hypothetical protein
MKRIGTSLFLVAALLFNLSAKADGYWLELKGSGKAGDTVTVTIRYGGVNDEGQRYIKTGKDLDKMAGFHLQVVNAGKAVSISLTQLSDCWQGKYVPAKAGVYQILAINNELPVVQRPDSLQNILPIQYLSTVYCVGTVGGDQSPRQFLDIVTAKQGNTIVITPYIDKQPVKKTKLRIFDTDNKDIFLVTDNTGKASFTPVKKGFYIIRLDKTDRVTGASYSMRHRCDYSLILE